MTVPKNADMLKFVTLGRSYDKNELIFNSECLNITVCDGARESALHYHTFFEIEVLLKGSAKTITDNTELQLSGGDCVFCMPGSVQKINLFNDATVVTMRFWELIGSMRLNAIGKTENPKRYLKTKKRRFYDPGTP